MRKFAFLAHPLSYEDVERYEPGAVGKGRAIIKKILEWIPPYVASHITGVRSTSTGEEIEGVFIGVPIMPEQWLELPRDFIMDRLVGAARLSKELGCGIIGLGGFSAVVGDGGVTLAELVPGIAVTTGNTYTIASGIQSLLRGARELDVDLQTAHAVVIGATGSIGSACSQILGNKVAHLTLAARNATRLKNLTQAMQPHVTAKLDWTTDIRAAVRSADLILTATSAVSAVVEPEDLRPGAVISEVSLPHDVSRRVGSERPDVLVSEGGNILVPGEPDFHFDFGLPPRMALACMSETMILTLENRFENYSLGRGIHLDKVLEMERLADKHGFKLATMRAFDKPVSDEQIARTRELARAARAAHTVAQAGAEHNGAPVVAPALKPAARTAKATTRPAKAT